ncbi:MAG: hypothetical protein NT007_10135 [Candidatus Kapabacteria bacterium]|nr:hypothetical protein [Candidatus Kapabacteria bacterium]
MSYFNTILNICFLIVLSNFAFAEEEIFNLFGFHLAKGSGALSFKGESFFKKTLMKNGVVEGQNLYSVIGEIKLNSNSYIWHKNFMELAVDLEYRPSANKENFIVMPDRSESVNAERISFNSLLLKALPINIKLNGNYGHSFSNRDKLSDLELISKSLGADIFFRNEYVPLRFNINSTDWNQKELLTARIFSSNSNSGSIFLDNRLWNHLENNLSYIYEDVNNDYTGYNNINMKINTASLRNTFYFDSLKESSFTSILNYQNLHGYQLLNKLDESLNLNMILPEDFHLMVNYNYSTYSQNLLKNQLQNIIYKLDHQLYLSLHSYNYIQYYKFKNFEYSDNKLTGGIGFNYKKSTDFDGMLYIDYECRIENQKRSSEPKMNFIQNESYVLSDGKITLLRNPYVDPKSIIVRNDNATIIFKENLDYQLNIHGNFIEVKRIPGGLITDGSKVYIDYLITKSENYNFNLFSNSVSVKYNVLKNLLEVYINYTFNNYNNLDFNTTPLLNTLNQKIFGIKSNYGPLCGGAEMQFYNSTILPYNSTNFYLRYQDIVFNHFIFMFEGRYLGYKYIETLTKQSYIEFNSLFEYPLTNKSKLKIEGAYSSQNNTGYSLNLLTLRTEYRINFLDIICSAGGESFYRKLNNETTDYRRFYVKLERIF